MFLPLHLEKVEYEAKLWGKNNTLLCSDYQIEDHLKF